MEGASEKPEEESNGREESDSESEDLEEGYSVSVTDVTSGVSEDSITTYLDTSTEKESEEATERPDTKQGEGSEDRLGRKKSRISVTSESSSQEESQVRRASIKTWLTVTPLEKVVELPSQEELQTDDDTETPLPSTGGKGLPTILGGVRRESSSRYSLSRESLDTIASDTLQQPLRISVSMQTKSSWLYDHSPRKIKAKLEDESQRLKAKVPEPNDIYTALSHELSSLDILCDTEFKEEFVKLFQESLQTLSCVGPPTILAFRRELLRGDIKIGSEEECVARCEFCGSLLKDIPSFESLEKLAEHGSLFCCQGSRDLQEFLVEEKKRCAKMGVEWIDIKPHHPHGSETERKLAREKARQRMRERQIAKQLSILVMQQEKEREREKEKEKEKETPPPHPPIDVAKQQLWTLSYMLSQDPPSPTSWSKIPLGPPEESESEEITYNISCCDFTIAGGKLLKNQFLQQYYKNGVKFLTMFPDGTAQIFYPSGNLAVIVVKKKENGGYICIVQEDKPENASIQAVFESSGQGTCYHPNGIVWINFTIRGGHYADQDGNKVRTWIWPNHLEQYTPTISFKPVFLSLNQNVGVRILGQDKVAISFLAMGKQAKINVGTQVKLSSDHHPWPKLVSGDDLVLFASRIKILKVFVKLQDCLEFSSNNQWTKFQLPSYISKQAMKLISLCRESDVGAAVDNVIMSILNTPA